jgi:hypothetical protein
MATPQKLAFSEIQLLQREIEAHGEWLSREGLERKTDTDRLRMELEALKRVISRLHPEFLEAFQDEMEVVRLEFNPETEGQR